MHSWYRNLCVGCRTGYRISVYYIYNIVPDESPSTGAEILPKLNFCYLLIILWADFVCSAVTALLYITEREGERERDEGREEGLREGGREVG